LSREGPYGTLGYDGAEGAEGAEGAAGAEGTFEVTTVIHLPLELNSSSA
jgi:hypothetical protein